MKFKTPKQLAKKIAGLKPVRAVKTGHDRWEERDIYTPVDEIKRGWERVFAINQADCGLEGVEDSSGQDYYTFLDPAMLTRGYRDLHEWLLVHDDELTSANIVTRVEWDMFGEAAALTSDGQLTIGCSTQSVEEWIENGAERFAETYRRDTRAGFSQEIVFGEYDKTFRRAETLGQTYVDVLGPIVRAKLKEMQPRPRRRVKRKAVKGKKRVAARRRR